MQFDDKHGSRQRNFKRVAGWRRLSPDFCRVKLTLGVTTYKMTLGNTFL